jgi:dCTP deaminase
MIQPFSDSVSGGGVISYGLTSAGYDLRLGSEFLVFKNTSGECIDPKRFKDENYRNRMFDVFNIGPEWNADGVVILPSGSYVLATSAEYLRIPRNLKARCVGKSTYARCGVIINTTPLEPEWEGYLTIEIGNVSPVPAKIYVGEGIAQIEFEILCGEPEVSYKDKGGKYQGQQSVTPAKVIA